jgi:hypothetical protein
MNPMLLNSGAAAQLPERIITDWRRFSSGLWREADKARMEKLRELKARNAASLAHRRQRKGERRLFRNL